MIGQRAEVVAQRNHAARPSMSNRTQHVIGQVALGASDRTQS